MLRRQRVLASLILLSSLVFVAACSQQTPAPAAKPGTPATAPAAAPAKAVAPPAPAAKYPERPITLVSTHPPGGAVDVPIRLIQPYLDKVLGSPVVVEPKPGAEGATALDHAWKAKPDGYTLISTVQTILDSAKINPGGEFEPMGFEHVAHFVGKSYQLVVVHKDSPYQTFKQLMDAAKAQPNKIKFGGVGGGAIVTHGLLQLRGDLKMTWVPYDGGATVLKALLGKEVDVITTGQASYSKHPNRADMRVLTVLGKERDPLLPNVPSAFESGYKIEVAMANVLMAPPKTPKNIVDSLANAVTKASADTTYQEAVKKAGLTSAVITGDAFKKWHQEAYDSIMEVKDALKPKK